MMADRDRDDEAPSTGKGLVGRVKESLGWLTADRRVEAEGQLEQLDAADPDGEPTNTSDEAEEAVLDEADLHVRADHGDLAPHAEPSEDRQPVKAEPPESG